MHEIPALDRNDLEIPIVVLDQRGGAEGPVAEPARPVPWLRGHATVAPPMRKPARRERGDHLEIALSDALHKAGRAARDRTARQISRTTPPRSHHATHVHMSAGRELQMIALATDRRKLPWLQGVSDQDYVDDLALAAHRQVGTAPRQACHIVVARQVQEAAAHSRQHNLEVPLRAAGPLDEQTTTSGHNPASSHPATLTVPSGPAQANLVSIESDPQ